MWVLSIQAPSRFPALPSRSVPVPSIVSYLRLMESKLIEQLSSFNAWKRVAALQTLAASTKFLPSSRSMNMHIHSFYSYNGEGWSPSRIAYEMRSMGLYGAALCDFDVIQGVEEFMAAGDLLGLRVAASFESRVIFPE